MSRRETTQEIVERKLFDLGGHVCSAQGDLEQGERDGDRRWLCGGEAVINVCIDVC